MRDRLLLVGVLWSTLCAGGKRWCPVLASEPQAFCSQLSPWDAVAVGRGGPWLVAQEGPVLEEAAAAPLARSALHR